MQCPECGREVDQLVHGACPSCTAARRTILSVPDVIDPTLCAHCGALERGARWETAPTEPERLVHHVVQAATVVDPDVVDVQTGRTIRWEDARNAMVDTHVSGLFHGVPVDGAATTLVRLKRGVCHECSRKHGGYFEAILQVRSHDPRVLKDRGEAVLGRIESELTKHRGEQRTGAYVSRADTVRGGYDFHVGSVEVGRLVAQSLVDQTGADYAESKSLVGRRNGQDMYRFTLLVRLPPYQAGDFVEFDGKICKVLRQERKMLTMWDLDRHDSFQREPKRAKSLHVLGHPEDEKDAVVVSRLGRALQILDPDTLQTVDVTAKWDVGDVETVRVFRHEGNLYLVPPDVAR